ncbi:MAG: hypothetical protein RSE01_00795 [Akkermansia sp.]
MRTAEKLTTYCILHIFLLIYAIAAIFSKLAAEHTFLSTPFLLCYGGTIFLLMIYAFGWQLILKKLPLGIAFSNRAITVIWYILAGILIFSEKLELHIVLGAIFIISGIIILSNNAK